MLKFVRTSAVACLMPLALQAAELRLVTDLPPVHSLVSLVAGDRAVPVLMMDQPGDGHTFALRPSQASALARADLVIWTGPEMAPWMARALEGGKKASLPLLQAPGTRLRAWGDGEHEPHDHEGHAHDEHDHEGHDHAHGDTDPHAWLEPANALYWLDLIARRLAEADPENAAHYRANAKEAAATLRGLDAELRALLEPVKDRAFVLGHDAYGYFTGHYGLHTAGTVAAGDAAGPGAQHLSALRMQLAGEEVVCAFPEVGQSERLLDTVLEGSAVQKGAALDPAGSTLEKGPGLYAALMRDLAQKISDCLK
ncbi:zinc ABC transporter substrate-binding protein [Falsigemmobacter faecalis]|uniref:High-affinity zinc uptake system protein ZnuA n=1 Tax=Falsigemmobacter faecalis TaxID=2488730 RepID=A0A3P3DWE4_9RHOB|nr:zinc ABC transporter substrate-binding protein [Falsigemmobacter faecalis]RRH78499.1 zinc ABC transporter substrate-binding protein [Falsigemmobacter faecalis]